MTLSDLPDHGHEPVLPDETLHYLGLAPGDTVVDCTLGRGGHSGLIADRIGRAGTLIALDADPSNLAYAAQRLRDAPCTTHLLHRNFAELDEVLTELGLVQVDAILADFGVSTNQLLDSERGLSFSSPDAPLDMRLDPNLPTTAADIVARTAEKKLADLIFGLADERGSRRIARKIIETRQKLPIQTVGQLAELVRSVLPRPKPVRGRKSPAIDPATRTFMALRMAVNRELDVLTDWLGLVPRLLKSGGRVVAISFHSGEDRLVKNAFRDARQQGTFELLTKKPVTAGDDELQRNPRARSAKLRAARRTNESLDQRPYPPLSPP